MTDSTLPTIGVVVVTFNSSDVILECLESLLGAEGEVPRIVVVDNGSTDGTPDLIRSWAKGETAYTDPGDLTFTVTPAAKPLNLAEAAPRASLSLSEMGDVTFIDNGVNAGFAGGVNVGLAALASVPDIDLFWVLNPDGVTTPDAPRRFAETAAANPGFSLMGSRVCYTDPSDEIQIDGGTINMWTGVSSNVNLGASHKATPPPDPAGFDFITGASMIASRAFYDKAGPLAEDYFLYYEEIDWALRRGNMPLIYARDALVFHRAGTAIGSPTTGRIASPFSMYFKYRARMMFVRRFKPVALPVTIAYAMAKAAQITLKGARKEALALIAGVTGRKPPKDIAARLSPEAQKIAFGRTL